MTKLFKKNKKGMVLTHFWPILRAKIFFLEYLALSHTTSHGFLAPCQNLENTKTQFQENAQTEKWTEGRNDKRMQGWKDRQTLFYKTLPATASGPNSFMNNFTHKYQYIFFANFMLFTFHFERKCLSIVQKYL